MVYDLVSHDSNHFVLCRSNGTPHNILFSTLMILKAACMHNPCYIDRLITTFMKVLQKMAREHLTASNTEANPGEFLYMIMTC